MTELAARKANAIRWMNELDATERIDELWPQFEAWLNESQDNKDAYREAELARCETEKRWKSVVTNDPGTSEALLLALWQRQKPPARPGSAWIPNVIPAGQELITIGHEAITDSGAGTVADVLEQLPQICHAGPNPVTHINDRKLRSNAGQATGTNLLGLDAYATTVLLNGRRLRPSGNAVGFQDALKIPAVAIDRIEILSGSASAIYGADAVAGVVNFITRNEGRRKLMLLGTVIAAVALAGIAVALVLPGSTKEARYTTEVGQVKTYTLEDGSVVGMDTDSSMRTRLSLTGRDLVLERGQIFVDVHKEWWRAFDVSVNQYLVHATGTRFAVHRKNDDEFSAAVQQGAVQITAENGSGRRPNPAIVIAGTSATITPRGMRLETNDPADVQADLAWLNGHIVLRNKPLIEAVNEFNRYNRRRLIVDDRSLDQRRIVGLFNTNDPDAFADRLADSHKIAHISIGARGSKSGEIHLRVTP